MARRNGAWRNAGATGCCTGTGPRGTFSCDRAWNESGPGKRRDAARRHAIHNLHMGGTTPSKAPLSVDWERPG
eukprot:11208433-Lingulodinium_polyedra.AAC.1